MCVGALGFVAWVLACWGNFLGFFWVLCWGIGFWCLLIGFGGLASGFVVVLCLFCLVAALFDVVVLRF